MKIISQDEAEARFHAHKLVLLSRYINNNVPVKVKCFCGTIYSTRPYQVFQKFRLSCGCTTGLNIKELKQKLKVRKLKLLSDFKSSYDKIKVQCFCGNVFFMRAYSKQQSCGCWRKRSLKELEKTLAEKDLSLLSRISSKHIDLYSKIKIKCFCGTVFWTIPAYVFVGDTTSCGCKQRAKGELHFNWKGYRDISGRYWRRIQNDAILRKRDFTIDIKYVWKLFVKQKKICRLSGVPISFLDHTASLDRINNNIGYIKGNVRFVHKTVNSMKWVFSDKRFKELCAMVSKPLAHRYPNKLCSFSHINPHFRGRGIISLSYWHKIQGRAKEKGINFNLNIDQAWNIFLKQNGYCKYTGETLCPQNMSLDRIDSNKGYNINNVQWVTKEINFMKREFKETAWLDFCGKIAKGLTK